MHCFAISFHTEIENAEGFVLSLNEFAYYTNLCYTKVIQIETKL